MNEARRKTNLLIRYHPAAWGITGLCVVHPSISGACGIGLHLAYLLAELYLGQGVFVQIMRKLENIYVGVSELGFGIGIGVYGFEDICPREGGLDTKHILHFLVGFSLIITDH